MNFDIDSKFNNYNVGLYIRLSREDDDKKLESESITNQKSLLLQYVKENNLKVYDIYIDDGYSGSNFDRPSFNKMIQDIELGKINMVITKDMSRLGRDYIGTGNLIEKYFPEHNVRYIAVTDNIDTFIDNNNNDIAPFKAIMNDMYAKDISKKIRSSLKAKQKEGKWVSGRCPFGYSIDIKNKNHLVINEEQAIVVRKIFVMALEGLSFYKIALKLTNEKIKTPAQYYNFKWKNNYHLNYGKWNSKTIKDILTNRMYIGDMIQNKRSKVNYKVKKVVKNNFQDYIIVESTHEAIIDKDTFYEVQKRIPKNIGRNEKKESHLLDGLLYCGDCKHRISVQSRRKKDNRCYTVCNYYRTYIKDNVCTTHSNNYDILEKEILLKLTQMCKVLINEEKLFNNLYKSNIELDQSIIIKDKLKLLQIEIEKSTCYLDAMYLDKIKGVINTNQYQRIKEKLENEINNKNEEIKDLNEVLLEERTKTITEKDMRKNIKKFFEQSIYSREVVVNLINKIYIYEDKNIDIYVDFTNS